MAPYVNKKLQYLVFFKKNIIHIVFLTMIWVNFFLNFRLIYTLLTIQHP